MKKILLSLFVLFLGIVSYGQYPVSQSLGSDSTLVTSKGGLKGRIVNWVFTDTTQANTQRIKDYPGAQIVTSSDTSLWFRSNNMWLKVRSSGSSVPTNDTLAWRVGGNDLATLQKSVNLGTLSADPIKFITNSTIRMVLDENGIIRSSGAANKCVTIDTITKTLYYYDCAAGGGGTVYVDSVFSRNDSLYYKKNGSEYFVKKLQPYGTPTLQQVLTAGSTLTGNNTVNGGGFQLEFTMGNGDFVVQQAQALSLQDDASGEILIQNGAIHLNTNSAGAHPASFIDVYKDSINIKPHRGHLEIDTLNYTLSTAGKKIMLRDTATGLVQNIDASLIGGGGGGGSVFGYQDSLYNRGIVIFYDNFKRSLIGPNYTTSLTGTTLSINDDGLKFVGTPNNYGSMILRNYYTSDENFTETVRYVNNTMSSTAYGIKLGVKGNNAFNYQHNVLASVIQETSATSRGKTRINADNAYSYQGVGTDSILAIAAGDSIELRLTRRGLTYTATTINLTNRDTSSFTITTQTGLTPNPFYANNTAQPSLHFFGGDITVYAWEYRVESKYAADYAFVGNSVAFGEASTAYDSSFAKKTFAADIDTITAILNSGGADYSQSVVDRLNEFKILKPKNVILSIGGNDILFGISTATWQANIVKIVDSLESYGIGVILQAPTPRTGTNIKPVRDYMDTTTRFSGMVKILTTFDNLVTGGTNLQAAFDAGDGVHLNNAGHDTVASLIRSGLTIRARTYLPTIPLSALRADGFSQLNAILTNHGWDTLPKQITSLTASQVGYGNIEGRLTSSANLKYESDILKIYGTNWANGDLLIQNSGGPGAAIRIKSTQSPGSDYSWVSKYWDGGFGLYDNSASTYVADFNREGFPTFKIVGNATAGASIQIESTQAGGGIWKILSPTTATGNADALAFLNGSTQYKLIVSTDGTFKIGADASGSPLLKVAGTTGAVYFSGSAGLAGQKLTSNGTGSAPTWKDTTAVPEVTESTYTPTLTNTTNIAASTAYTTHYQRIGDVVHVWGEVSIDATTALSVCEMGLSIPVDSGFGNSYELAGTASFEDNTTVQIKADATNDRAMFRFTPQTATNNRYSFHFTYKYIAP